MLSWGAFACALRMRLRVENALGRWECVWALRMRLRVGNALAR